MSRVPEGAPYAAAWRQYKRRRATFWLAYLGGFAALFLATSLYVNLTGRPANWLSPFGLLLLLLYAVTAIRLTRWKCPRCEQPFHLLGIYRNCFSRRCLHCGLPKWAPGPDAG